VKTHAENNPLALRSGKMEVPYTPRRGYADGPFGQIHFRDTGTGVPLVLLHQAPQTSRQFTNVYEPLHRRGIRAIGMDLPGFGESDPTDFVPSIEDWATCIPALLDTLNIDSANLLGHHTGGIVATEAALQFSDRTTRLIVNGPIPMDEAARRESLEWVRAQEIERPWTADASHMLEAFQRRLEVYGDDADISTITRYTVERFQGYVPFWIGHHAAFLYDHRDALKRLAVPTLILTNTGDMVYGEAQEAMRLRPDFAYAELEGGGIDIVDQQPENWAQAVADFLFS